MPTRLWLRNVLSPDAPANGTQSVLTPDAGSNTGSGVEDRLMTPSTLGTLQVQFAASVSGTGSHLVYNGRFISDPLAAQHIAAANLTFGVAAGSGQLSGAELSPQIYLWRPSTLTVVTRIRSTSTVTISAGNTANDSEMGFVRTLSNLNGGGAPDLDPLDGDVIVLENWTFGSQGTIGTRARRLWFDGTDDIVDGAIMTNAATYLEFPADLIFLTPYPVAIANQLAVPYASPLLRM